MLLIPPCEVDIIATLLTYSNAGIAQSAKIGDGLKQEVLGLLDLNIN